jgi:hypothetical protein
LQPVSRLQITGASPFCLWPDLAIEKRTADPRRAHAHPDFPAFHSRLPNSRDREHRRSGRPNNLDELDCAFRPRANWSRSGAREFIRGRREPSIVFHSAMRGEKHGVSQFGFAADLRLAEAAPVFFAIWFRPVAGSATPFELKRRFYDASNSWTDRPRVSRSKPRTRREKIPAPAAYLETSRACRVRAS